LTEVRNLKVILPPPSRLLERKDMNQLINQVLCARHSSIQSLLDHKIRRRILLASMIFCGLLIPACGIANQLKISTQLHSRSSNDTAQHNATQRTYLPYRGELRRCFVTNSAICIFQERFGDGLGLHYYSWETEDIKAVLQAEIAAKLAKLEEYQQAILLAREVAFPLPKIAALTQIAAYYGKTGQINQAQRILTEAEQTARNSNRPVESLPRVAVQYAALGQEQIASQIIEEVVLDLQSSPYPLSSPEIGKTTEIIASLLKLDRTSQAEQLIRQILRDDQRNTDTNCTPSPCPQFNQASSYTLILEPLLIAQKSDLAIRLIQEEIRELGYQNATLYQVSQNLAILGEIDRALAVLQAISENGSTHNTGTPGNIPVPIDINQVVSSAVPDLVTEQKSSIDASNQAIQLAETGNITDALSMAETISLPYHKTLALTEIALYLFEVEQLALAEQVLAQAVQTATTLGGNHLGFGDQQGLSIVAVRLAEAGQFTRALEVVNGVKAEFSEATDEFENQPYKIVVLINISDQYIRLGQSQNALEVLSTALEKTELL